MRFKLSTLLQSLVLAGLLTATARVVHADEGAHEPPEAAIPTESDSTDTEARFTASLETWLYATRTWLNMGSELNPGNLMVRIPSSQALLDARLNLRAEIGPIELLATPRLVSEHDWAGSQTDASVRGRVADTHGSTDLTQCFVRVKWGNESLVAGRELLSWGPATFRSPSNPFYFDAGRTAPLAATPGVDLLRYTHAIDSVRIHAAYVWSTDQLNPPSNLADTRVLKIDQQGENYLLSLNATQRTGSADFIGGFAQFTPSDAWLVYGEFGSSSQPAPNGRSELLGASYTLESGHVITAEWLHNQGGFTREEQDRYFGQAVAANALAQINPPLGYALLGQTLSQTPRLLGRNYLWASLQSNPQDNKLYWRTEWAQNLMDHSARAMFYIEKNLASKLSGFVVLSTNLGGSQTDFGTLTRTSVTVGIKLFVF